MLAFNSTPTSKQTHIYIPFRDSSRNKGVLSVGALNDTSNLEKGEREISNMPIVIGTWNAIGNSEKIQKK